jgi:hypothetical protein
MPPSTATNSAPAAACAQENLMDSPDLTDNDYRPIGSVDRGL